MPDSYRVTPGRASGPERASGLGGVISTIFMGQVHAMATSPRMKLKGAHSQLFMTGVIRLITRATCCFLSNKKHRAGEDAPRCPVLPCRFPPAVWAAAGPGLPGQ